MPTIFATKFNVYFEYVENYNEKQNILARNFGLTKILLHLIIHNNPDQQKRYNFYVYVK
jgi:hypothetical protein